MRTDQQTSHARQKQMLKTALGDILLGYLDTQDIIEIMLNPDGKVVVERIDGTKSVTDLSLSSEQSTNIIRLLATMAGVTVGPESPILSTPLPIINARFQGILPPVVLRPTFAIRKHLAKHITLQDYVKAGTLQQKDCERLKQAVLGRKNIIVAGGASSGKTTFSNALMEVLNESKDRILILEDLPELQCHAEDIVRMTSTLDVSMQQLVKSALRMRPDRIIVGEVRDGSALDLLKAWNTGHPGGICTLHANSANSVPARLHDLISETAAVVPMHLIEEAIDVIVYMKRDKQGVRRIDDIKM